MIMHLKVARGPWGCLLLSKGRGDLGGPKIHGTPCHPISLSRAMEGVVKVHGTLHNTPRMAWDVKRMVGMAIILMVGMDKIILARDIIRIILGKDTNKLQKARENRKAKAKVVNQVYPQQRDPREATRGVGRGEWTSRPLPPPHVPNRGAMALVVGAQGVMAKIPPPIFQQQ